MKKKPSKSPSPAQRQTERLTISLPITVQAYGAGSGRAAKEVTTTVNLSRTGLSFIGRKKYEDGSKLRAAFKGTEALLRRGAGIPLVVMRVFRSQTGDGFIVGARFEDEGLAGLALVELLRAQMRTSIALLDIIQAISPGAEVGQVIGNICRATERALESEKALLFLPDRDRKLFREPGGNDSSLNTLSIKPGKGLLGYSIAAKHLLSVSSPASDSRFQPKWDTLLTPATRSVLCVPLEEEKGHPLGLLVILNKRYGTFSPEDEELGSAVARQISAVLREAVLFETINHIKNFNERILGSIANSVITFDKDGKVTSANRAAVKTFNLNVPADIGKEISSLFHQKPNTRLVSLADGVLKTQRRKTSFDVRFLRNDGANLSLNLTAMPLTDQTADGTQSEFPGGLLVAEDITQEQRYMSTLCRYLAREVAEQVMEDKDKLKLGGNRADATILMADIRNFTTISEQMDPKDLMDMLNTYFPRMINVIFRHHGMVDKLIGDAILAVFGVPIFRDDDALRAVQAALDMRKELVHVNKDLARKNYAQLEIGIGITSGTVISGNIGSERRMDFTVIGDPVNLAARLESLTKDVHRKILINDRVRQAVEKVIPCEALGMFNVKGKKEEVPVFSVNIPE